MKLIPYIMYAGNAEDALNFYKDILGGEIKGIQRYGETPMPSADNYKDKIMHSTFEFDDNVIMVSDSMPGNETTKGSNVHLSLDVKDTAKMDEVFNKLADGGKVSMPLQDTFWGARFGMLTDKFGINWMFNCELNK
ncbi:MAG: VOC family protein [Chitinophagaceae bacterium]